jgi:UDP-glucose 4-epimerase
LIPSFKHLFESPQYPPKVVLLGANGFIARYLRADLIAEGVECLAISSDQIDMTSSQAVGELGRLLTPEDVVVMLAAITPDKGRGSDAFLNNFLMMHHLSQALQQRPVSHLILISSDAVYGSKQSYVAEHSPVVPHDLYGSVHLAREKMLDMLEMPSLALRVTMAYGVGDTHNSYGPNRFYRMAVKDGEILLFGRGEEKRDHIHVGDVAKIIRLCIEWKTTGILNAVTGISNSYMEVAEMVRSIFPREINLKFLVRASDITHRHYDNTNLIKAFPNLYLTSLVDGIAYFNKGSV